MRIGIGVLFSLGERGIGIWVICWFTVALVGLISSLFCGLEDVGDEKKKINYQMLIFENEKIASL